MDKEGLLIGIEEIIPLDKVSPNIIDPDKFKSLHTYDSSNATIKAVVSWYDMITQQLGESILRQTGIEEIIDFHYMKRSFKVRATRAVLVALAEQQEISRIYEEYIPHPTNANARRATNVDSLQKDHFSTLFPPSVNWLAGAPYTGDSIWVWNGEHGPYQHIDFFEMNGIDTLLRGDTIIRTSGPRLVKGTTGSWGLGGWGTPEQRMHGVHTGAIIAGNGWGSHTSILLSGSDTLKWRGVAPKAMFVDSITDWQQGIGDVNNHSFTGGDAFYTIGAENADFALSNHDPTLPIPANDFNNIGVYAAANQGVANQWSGTGQIGYYSLLQNNKNGIIVGAVESSLPNPIAIFSSLGPTRDGRIKPNVVAPGKGLLHDGFIIEFDSIAIKSSSGAIKKSWNFNDGTDGFTRWEMYFVTDTSRLGGIYRLTTQGSPYFWTNPIYPATTVVTQNNDSLFVRVRIAKRTAFVPDTVMLTRIFRNAVGNPWQIAGSIGYNHKICSDNSWVNFTLPLTWATGDTIPMIRFDFGYPEVDVISADSVNDYVGMQGTSMAAPHVTGIIALMLQKYNEEVIHSRNRSGLSLNIHQNAFWNSTARAILIHTATDLVDTIGRGINFREQYNPEFMYHSIPLTPVYGMGPDWVTGWDLVNAVKAIEYTDTTRFFEDTIGQVNTIDRYFMYIPLGTSKFRTTIAWDDPPGTGHNDTVNAYLQKLINDLDLQLINLSTGGTLRPWILDHSPLNNGVVLCRPDSLPSGVHLGGLDTLITPAIILNNPASRTTGHRDSLNNLEVVDIDNPQSRLWEIRVIARSIAANQTLPADPMNRRQDYSLIHDFPLIKDTATTNWRVSSSGAGDVRSIGDALDLASSGDTVTVTTGSYTVTDPDSTNGVTLIFRPGVSVNFNGFDAFIYIGTGGKIVGAENVILSPQIVLYNTPSAREPQPADNVIGLFGNLCRAIMVSTPGKTIKTGPSEYNIWTLSNEGLIGVRDPDRSKSSVIRLYFPGTPVCAAEPPQPPSSQKTLIMNMRIEVDDENSLPNALVSSGNEEIEFANCTFDNIDANGVIRANMIGIGDTANVRTGINRFTNCLFRNFKTAVRAFACTTQAQSPYFTNYVFERCSTDIAFPTGSTALCNIPANQLNSITIGTQRYTGATAINNLIISTCGGLPKRNVYLSNIALVDDGYSDFRPAPRSPLIDNGLGNSDIGADNIDMIYTFSRFLDATILFGSGDTIIMTGGVLPKNTIGSIVTLKQTNTLNLRPVYRIIITSNYIDRPSEIRIRLNAPSFNSDLPSDYVVFDVKINGYVFTRMEAADIPLPGDSTVIQGIPDNVPPAPVSNIAAAQVGSNVVVSWNLNSEPDISRYKVYRSPSANPNLPVQIASVNKSTSSYTDAGRTLSGFVYNVIAYDSTGNQSYSYPGLPLKVEMKDNGIGEVNITKPQIKVTNLSSEPIKGFKMRVWFSRQEFVGKEIVVDRYYFSPSAITTTKGVHPLNPNIVYVELGYPSTYQLNPGSSTPADGIQFGVHYTNYYPGQWNKSNDWSSYGITGSFSVTQRVTVYDSIGMLLAGNEPTVYSSPMPPVINVAEVFGFENCNGWSVSAGTMSSDNTNKTQGIASVNFAGGGYQEIISTDLPTAGITGEKSPIKMDFYVGTSQPNPYYVGTLTLYANCPSAGLTNIYIGQKDLTPLTRGSFTTLSFTLPTNVLNAMKGMYTDFSFKFLLNTNTSSGPYKMDNMRF